MMSGQIKRGGASTPFSYPSLIRCKNQAKVIHIYQCINQYFLCQFTVKIILWEKVQISSCKYQNDSKFQEFKTSQTSGPPKVVVATLQKSKRRGIHPCVPQLLCSPYSNVHTCIIILHWKARLLYFSAFPFFLRRIPKSSTCSTRKEGLLSNIWMYLEFIFFWKVFKSRSNCNKIGEPPTPFLLIPRAICTKREERMLEGFLYRFRFHSLHSFTK